MDAMRDDLYRPYLERFNPRARDGRDTILVIGEEMLPFQSTRP